MNHARIEGTVVRVNRRGKTLVCFEGTGLTKIGRGETVKVEFGDLLYSGELVAIGPTRAIVQISPVVFGHGITTTDALAAVVA